jgi:nucleoside-diphosphate-sugar epimerase
MNISITGSNGFIGFSLLKRLLNNGHNIKILTSKKSLIVNPNVKSFYGDFSSDDVLLNSFIADSDLIINCAGELTDKAKMQSVNVAGVKKLIMLASRQINNIKFLQLGSAGVYDKTKIGIDSPKINETYSYFSKKLYEKSKYQADKFLINYAKESKISFTILRPSAIFCKDMPNNSLRRLIHYVRKRYFFYIGSNDAIMSYLHLDDLVDIMVKVIDENSFNNRIYNLSCDTELYLTINAITNYYQTKKINKTISKNLYYFISSILPSNSFLPINKSIYHSMTSKATIDSSLAKKDLGFEPKKSLPNYITDLIR